jgi:nitrite reductase/ring-hydroxylating ferredoxin subunit
VAQKRGFNFSLARHYDKGIAVVVLVALLVSLFELAQSAAESKDRKSRFQDGVKNMRPQHATLTPLSVDPYEKALRDLHFPQTVRASTNGVGLFIPQRRVWCVDCLYPIPFAAAECPFCHAKQPLPGEPVDPSRVDSEGKGIPDKWRMKYFHHADARVEDLSRAEDDADDDGFTNLQEFQAETNPRDPKDHPELTALLRFKEIATRPYPFIFTSVTHMPDGSLQLTFNEGERTYFAKKGEAIGKTGLVYSNCIQKSERVLDPRMGVAIQVDRYEVSLFRTADGKTFVLRNNDPHATMEQQLVLTLTVGSKTTEYRVSVGGLLELDGQRYKVAVNLVDDKPSSVVLENTLTTRKSTVSIGSL